MDSLERVRQLFAGNLLQSAFLAQVYGHRPQPHQAQSGCRGLTILGPAFAGFAENDLRHADSAPPARPGLGWTTHRRPQLYRGAGLDLPVQRWFTHRVKPSRVARTWLKQALAEISPIPLTAERRCVWTEALPSSCHAQRADQHHPPHPHGRLLAQPFPPQVRWLLTLLRDSMPSSSGRLHLPALRRHDGDVSRLRHSRVQAIRRFRRLADHQAGRAAARLTRKPSRPRLPSSCLEADRRYVGLGTAQVFPASIRSTHPLRASVGELLTHRLPVFFPYSPSTKHLEKPSAQDKGPASCKHRTVRVGSVPAGVTSVQRPAHELVKRTGR